MEDWKECTLNDICYYGKDRVNVADLDNSNYISTENMIPNRGGITSATTLPTGEQTPGFEIDDTLVSNIRPYFKKIWKATFEGGCSADVLNFKAKENISKDYLYYVLSDDEFFKYCMTTSKGTKMPRGDKVAIMQYPIHLPPLPTQQKIASILSSLDDKIELNNKINANLEQQAQSLFKNWFVDFAPFGGKMPAGWKEVKVGELPIYITDYVSNGSFADLKQNVKLYQEENFAYFIRNTDLKVNTFNTFVDEHSYNFLEKSKLNGGEIIISNVGDVGSVFICPKLEKPMTLGNNIIMLRCNEEIYRYYLYIWFKWFEGKNRIKGITGGSVLQKFNKTDFKNMSILEPAENQLKQFSEIITPYFESIKNNTEENKKLSSIRDTLLPKLMSGELEVN